MSGPVATDFDSLRAQAIAFAQAASGNIWTDYNLHDPGVTLLEQTCFALSEIGYQAAHPIRDLLTDEQGRLRYTDLALYDPRSVLPGAPVTDLDLTSYLSDQPDVTRAWVSQTATPGLYSVVVIPAEQEDLDEAVLAERVRGCFARVRPLATDLAEVVIARKRETVLTCEIEISPTADPERVAAWFYYNVSAILRGRAAEETAKASATRAAVYSAPELFFRPRAETGARMPDIDVHLARLRAIPGIRDIGPLSFRELPLGPGQDTLKLTYPALVLPAAADEIELQLRVGDNILTLDHNRIQEEYIRVAAESISRAHHHLDDGDWSVLKDGRRRRFDRSHVDDMLPAIYRIYGDGRAQGRAVQNLQPKVPREDDLFLQYRGAINAQLDDMSTALAELPRLFTAETDRTTDDPALHAGRVKLLDLLLALQGETLPSIRHAGLHQYRSAAARQAFDLHWRLSILRALPELNAARGTAPEGAAPGGFMARLGLLADLSVQLSTDPTAGLAALGWELDQTSEAPAPDFPRKDLLLPLNPFEMIVPRDDHAEPLAPEDLKSQSPWVADDKLQPAFFQRAATPDAFAITPVSGGRYAVVFDSGDEDALYRVQTMQDKAQAIACVNRLRASWRALHEEAEVAYLVEDVLLRGTGRVFEANRCTLVLTGWTARTALDSYRSYVAELVQQLAPVHVVISLVWLDVAEMTRFHGLKAKVESPEASSDDCEALRLFLKTAGAGS
ncbi:hypothetical protein [uncultured Roseobacter sp.]|uniref:hypothetical protein n=1 Tax=uncultured Roseobacter sp. TaxID=114847 RepID=UPI0026089F9B|nr:hypothetical protein [uncultured Roseobacter sp.]